MALIVLIIVLLAVMAFILYRCLDKYIHSEEKIKHDQWEDEKMIMP